MKIQNYFSKKIDKYEKMTFTFNAQIYVLNYFSNSSTFI